MDASDARVTVRDNDLGCDAILFPGTDIPSSLGCVVVVQGLAASIGFPFKLRATRSWPRAPRRAGALELPDRRKRLYLFAHAKHLLPAPD